ncbi:LuxR C-terminal-related transcriptional regulator [Marinobacterium stanieri]|uniref:Transcriptional regulator, LuxR family n=1 Tax=Marinobacterium stanieri TaxID=49186 RepID=A0A1N6NCD1_9GAMM|nr:LuxR C-terminal-related transcriptional regulator [Marinobacterium stanieri]SIP89725.1 transcriptional regulator, LuxR family [Marinobacterium stanieri]
MIKSSHLESPSAQFNRSLATLIDHSRLKSFPNSLVEFLSELCHFDTALMVTYKKSFKPIIIYPTDPGDISITLHNYINKYFVLDPLFNAIQAQEIATISRLSEIAPDSFESTEYYQSCYKNFDLTEEISLVTQLNQQVTCALTLGRKSTLGPVTRAELQRLQSIAPVISSLIRQFWLSQSQEYVKYEKSDSAMKEALKTFASGVLTRREQEITALILQGHSSKAIAGMLNISPGTVKVHRKNIHTRLNTSTQSEIFNLFLTHLNELENQGAQ